MWGLFWLALVACSGDAAPGSSPGDAGAGGGQHRGVSRRASASPQARGFSGRCIQRGCRAISSRRQVASRTDPKEEPREAGTQPARGRLCEDLFCHASLGSGCHTVNGYPPTGMPASAPVAPEHGADQGGEQQGGQG
jgi:hypothetical protein